MCKPKKCTPLHSIAISCHAHTADLLTHYVAGVNVHDDYGDTLLHNTDTTDLLMKQCAGVHVLDYIGRTQLQLSSVKATTR